MTPAIKTAEQAGVSFSVHEYNHDPSAETYGMEAAERLGLAPERVFKTLVVSLDQNVHAVAMVPVSGTLNLKQLARAAGAKKATMVDPREVQRLTGYVLGGVSPLGQKKPLAAFLDESAQMYPTVYVSAGRRGLEIELEPAVLAELTEARLCDLQAD